MIAKLLQSVGAVTALGVVVYFALPHLVCMGIPKQQKLTDCTSNALAFHMTCERSPPYQFVLGLGPSHTGQFAFRGELLIRQTTGVVARIEIDSAHASFCNWLPGVDGYILTWHRTNAGERLSEFLSRGQSYDVGVTFVEGPPSDSSLWFTSIGRAKW